MNTTYVLAGRFPEGVTVYEKRECDTPDEAVELAEQMGIQYGVDIQVFNLLFTVELAEVVNDVTE